MFKRILVLIVIVVIGSCIFYSKRMHDIRSKNAPIFAEHIKTINPNQVVSLVTAARGKQSSILFIYKSSCILCRIYFPDIVRLANEYKINVVAISIDDSIDDLANFLVDKDPPFEPYMIDKSKLNELSIVLKSMRIFYDGDVPYTVVIDNIGDIMEFSATPTFYQRLSTFIGKKTPKIS